MKKFCAPFRADLIALPVVFAAICLVISGCDKTTQDPVSSGKRTPGSGPNFTFINNPDNGNPRIVRFGSLAGFLLVDDKANLFSLQAGTNRQFGCVTPDFFSFMDVQRILHNPEDPLLGQINEVRLGRDIYIAVFQGPFGTLPPRGDPSFCAELLSRKLAEGFGNFTNTDNDLFPFLRENNNANAFGFVAQGKLERVGGGRAHYNGLSKCVWDGQDLASLKCTDKINFR